MGDGEQRQIRSRRFERVVPLTLQIDKCPLAYEVKSQIADLRLTCGRPEDLVDDTMADGDP